MDVGCGWFLATEGRYSKMGVVEDEIEEMSRGLQGYKYRSSVRVSGSIV